MDLFDVSGLTPTVDPSRAPLAVRMRPTTVDEVAGQAHLLVAGSPLRRMLEPGAPAPT
ncbi:MAG: replication-associated recombination protein A, partial [Micrococcales bacterium]|nr:replication-associated recombination protein A [Micrococcales bacterium]